jgi:hypothetical protein
LGLFSSRCLALRLAARVLTHSDSRIRTEPTAADRAGSFPEGGHGDSSSPCPGSPVRRSTQTAWVILG